jgi:hypothetical protein
MVRAYAPDPERSLNGGLVLPSPPACSPPKGTVLDGTLPIEAFEATRLSECGPLVVEEPAEEGGEPAGTTPEGLEDQPGGVLFGADHGAVALIHRAAATAAATPGFRQTERALRHAGAAEARR